MVAQPAFHNSTPRYLLIKWIVSRGGFQLKEKIISQARELIRAGGCSFAGISHGWLM